MSPNEIAEMIEHDEQARKFARMVASHMTPHQCSFTPAEVAAIKAMLRWARVFVYALIASSAAGFLNLVFLIARRSA